MLSLGALTEAEVIVLAGPAPPIVCIFGFMQLSKIKA